MERKKGNRGNIKVNVKDVAEETNKMIREVVGNFHCSEQRNGTENDLQVGGVALQWGRAQALERDE